MGTVFLFFQSPGASPDCHHCSSITKSSLAATSASFFRSQGCISFGPIDLCTFRFLRWLPAPGILLQWERVFFPIPSLLVHRFKACEERYPVRTEAKNSLSISICWAFYASVFTTLSVLLIGGGGLHFLYFSFLFLFWLACLQKYLLFYVYLAKFRAGFFMAVAANTAYLIIYIL